MGFRARGAVMIARVYRDDEGKAIKFAWPGGYTVVYLVDDGEYLCADCVNDPTNPVHEGGDADGWRLEGSDIHYEGAAIICAHCGTAIDSAYGDPEEVQS